MLTTTALVGLTAPGAIPLVPGAAGSARAAEPGTPPQYWDGVGTTPGGVANGRGGLGIWNATSTNWTNQAGTANAPWAGGTAFFSYPALGTGPYRIIVDGKQSVDGLVFGPEGASQHIARLESGIDGGLAIDGATVVEVQQNVRNGSLITIDLPIGGVGGLVKTGAGGLLVAGANTYSGGTTIEAGSLSVLRTPMSTGSLGTGPVTLNGGSLSFGNGIRLGGITLTNNNAVADPTRAQYADGIDFFAGSSAGSSHVVNNGGVIRFAAASAEGGAPGGSAGTATIDNSGWIYLGDGATADQATIVNAADGLVVLQGPFGGGGRFAIGSLSGAGDLDLRGNNLTLGGLGNDDLISGVISDSGSGGTLWKFGNGTLTLTGANTFAGLTTVLGGDLMVDGSLAGGVSVGETGISLLGGSGTIGGPVTIGGSGGVLLGRSGSTLTFGSSLEQQAGSVTSVTLGAPGTTPLFDVIGNLTLDGTLHAAAGTGFTGGTYRLFDYGGTLTDNGLVVTSVPAGHNPGDWSIDTGTAGQVDLLAVAGPGEQYWDGANTTPGGIVNGRGGSGVWNASNTNWTNQAGTINAPWASGTAVFAPQAGNYTVTIEGEQSFAGLRLLASGGPTENITYLNAGTNGALAIAGSSATIESQAFRNAVIDTAIGGAGELVKTGSGEAVLARMNTYAGGTRIEAGRLSVNQSGTLGSGPVTITGGTLLFYGALARDFGDLAVTNTGGAVQITAPEVDIGSLSGAGNVDLGSRILTVGALGQNDVIGGAITGTAEGQLIKTGSGTLTLAGTTTYGGPTQAHEGRLVIDGSVAGHVTVNTTGILAGSGSIAGTVSVSTSGILEGRSGQTLTMGNLHLNSIGGADSIVNVALGAPSSTALFDVTGNLTLDGTLNVTDAGGFGDGVYRIFDYGGTLTDNGLDVGSMPAGATGTVQTAIANQVNLVVGGTVDPGPIPTIQFWNGAATTPTGTVAGGSGIWTGGPVTNWTDANGTRSDPWNGNFAVFQGAAGTVTVDAAGVSATGMQFAVDGYAVQGGGITLNAPATVRVGDGSAAGAGYTATIASTIAGPGGLVKDDLGTLVLSGANTYTGGTTVAAGTLQIDQGGSIVGDVVNNGQLFFNHGSQASFAGAITGSGTVQVGPIGVGATSSLTLTANNSYTGGTSIGVGSTFTLGDGGTTGSIAGDVDIYNTASLVFDRSNGLSFDGRISSFSVDSQGNGGTLRQVGSGLTTLAGDSSTFVGTTRIEAGGLAVNGQLGGTLEVWAGGRLQGTGTVGDVDVAGVVAPGNAIGTINVGSITFDSGSIYEVEVNAAGQTDLVRAGGTATIDGGTVRVLAGAGDYAPATTYTILTADGPGGRSGRFDGVTSNLAFLDPSLSYDASNVYLTMTRNGTAFQNVGITPNQIAAGGGVEALGIGNPIHDAILTLSAPQARRAFDQVSGEVHASGRHVIDETFALFNRTLRHQGVAGAGSGNAGAQVFTAPLGYGPAMSAGNAGLAAIDDASGYADARVRGAWIAPLGGFGQVDGDGNAAQLDWWSAGLAGGYEGVIDVGSGNAAG
ncbi:beta strand repeat-containing protein, partial [Shinella sp. BYT-45]|uniref:beta strand repeat-containing protein n=1 Tax=Shinella sp. BYT-45 TaxID=3377377 RepID=UPI0039806141